MIVDCPSNVMLNITNNSGTAIGIWVEPTAFSNGNSVPVVEQSHQSGDSFGMGTAVVRYLFRDSLGNEALCEFMVVVVVFIEGTCMYIHTVHELLRAHVVRSLLIIVHCLFRILLGISPAIIGWQKYTCALYHNIQA